MPCVDWSDTVAPDSDLALAFYYLVRQAMRGVRGAAALLAYIDELRRAVARQSQTQANELSKEAVRE